MYFFRSSLVIKISVKQLTWSFPPHSPAGTFATRDIPLTTDSLEFNRQVLHLNRTMLKDIFIFLRGSFRLRLASIFNHRPVDAHHNYKRAAFFLSTAKGYFIRKTQYFFITCMQHFYFVEIFSASSVRFPFRNFSLNTSNRKSHMT